MAKYKVAFIGRSNVGKSSLINYLLSQNVAKTSKHPGKTRDHDIFNYSPKLDLVDMPGYGYAKVEGIKRQIWDIKMQHLFFEDQFLRHIFVLIDSSIKPMKIDQEFLEYLITNDLHFSLIFTKIDKAKTMELKSNLSQWHSYITLLPATFGPIKTFQVSSFLQKGKGEIKQFIESL